jgi:transcriptional regulator of heat shock response
MYIMITQRQEKLLNTIIQEYVDSAEPVSSQVLQKKHDFGICPATIRIEMQKLTDQGFLCQPHTSAGRVPTDKGYRFFVDNLLKKEFEDFEMGDWLKEESGDEIKFIQALTKDLARLSGALALSYLEKESVLWREGWEDILREPEFGEKDFVVNFAKFLENFENNIEDFEIDSGINVYIGKENPFKKAKDFTLISCRCRLPKERGIVSLVGPKRMAYDKNISLINSLVRVMEDF